MKTFLCLLNWCVLWLMAGILAALLPLNKWLAWLLAFFAFTAGAVIIPVDRLPSTNAIPWQGMAGVPGGIPNRTTIFVNLITTSNPLYKCTADGLHDCLTNIQNAINNCPSNQVVYAPAGTYYVSSQLRIFNPNYWTLRGDGMGQTIITGGNNITLFGIGNSPFGGSWPSSTPVTAGATKGSTQITVNSTANIINNQLMWIEQLNDGLAVVPFGSGTPPTNPNDRLHDNTHVFNTRVMVTNISGNNVSFTPPLPFDFSPSLSPDAVGFNNIVGPVFSGIENLTIKGSTNGNAVTLTACYGFWLKNVEITGYGGFGMQLFWNACCEIRHCYIHEPFTFNRDNGYPIQFETDNNFLIEDNIIWKFQAGLIMQGGSAANVIAYNFMFQEYDVYPSGISFMLGSQYANHTPFPTMNLYEGNYANEFKQDFYYGASARTTALRNYFTGTDPDILQNRFAVAMDSHQWSNSVVGNILGSVGTHATVQALLPNTNISWANTTNLSWNYDDGLVNGFPYSVNNIYRFGYPNSGNNNYTSTYNDGSTNNIGGLDLLVRTNSIIHGNWDFSTKGITWSPSISDTNIPNSLYLSGPPGYFGSLQWPPYDPHNPSVDLTNIPAGYRFIYGVDPPTCVVPIQSLTYDLLFPTDFQLGNNMQIGEAPGWRVFALRENANTDIGLVFLNGYGQTNWIDTGKSILHAGNGTQVAVVGTNVFVAGIDASASSNVNIFQWSVASAQSLPASVSFVTNFTIVSAPSVDGITMIGLNNGGLAIGLVIHTATLTMNPVYLSPSGVWTNMGQTTLGYSALPPTFVSSAEMPGSGTWWTFSTKDSGGTIIASEWVTSTNGHSGLFLNQSFTFADSSGTPHNYGELTPYTEICTISCTSDTVSNRILFAYNNDSFLPTNLSMPRITELIVGGFTESTNRYVLGTNQWVQRELTGYGLSQIGSFNTVFYTLGSTNVDSGNGPMYSRTESDSCWGSPINLFNNGSYNLLAWAPHHIEYAAIDTVGKYHLLIMAPPNPLPNIVHTELIGNIKIQGNVIIK